MADKILRITFSGICTLSPEPPKGMKQTVDRAFIIMAEKRKDQTNAWGVPVAEHTPFVYVPVSAIGGSVPPPSDFVYDQRLGVCNIYFFHNANVTLDPSPNGGVSYYRSKFNIADQPGPSDVADENDIRWVLNMDEIVKGATLRTSSDPDSRKLGEEVAAVVTLTSGVLKANFPCKTLQPRTFSSRATGRDLGVNRVLASEFFVDVNFPEETQSVRIRFDPLRSESAAGVGRDLFLQWGNSMLIEMRMGNDTKEEVRSLPTSKRCDARVRDTLGRPVPVARDEDFDLHYEVIALPDGVDRPIPQNGPHQTHFDGCSPATVRKGGTT